MANTVKPNDLVRTPLGRTARCEGLNRDGSRLLRDVITGELFDLKPRHLTIIMPAPVFPWKTHKL